MSKVSMSKYSAQNVLLVVCIPQSVRFDQIGYDSTSGYIGLFALIQFCVVIGVVI